MSNEIIRLALAVGLTTLGCGNPRQPGASSPLGVACQDSTDCTSGLSCDTTNLRGQCTYRCTTARDCESYSTHALCWPASFSARVCVQACDFNSDCPAYSNCNSSGWCER